MNDMSAIPVPPDLSDEFFRQQESLHAEHIRSIARGRRTAWWVAGCAIALAVLDSVAIASLAPLHSVEWRLVRVDSSTGAIDVVNQLTDAPKTVTEANARATMALYVQRREGYAAPEVEYNFRSTSLMSAPAEQRRYADAVRGGNPDSPQVVFGKGGFVRISVESVSVLGPGLGQVRFARQEQKDGGTARVTQWIATIGFEWKPDALMSNADRTIDPLGFQVSDYHVDASQ
jgi:type IV secretion system protein VirB8